MKRPVSIACVLSLLLLGAVNLVLSQSLIGTWDFVSGPGTPNSYEFIDDSMMIVRTSTRMDTVIYATSPIASSALRKIELGRFGVVGWRGVYQLSPDSQTLTMEGYWYTGMPVVEAPTSFSTPTTYTRSTAGIRKAAAGILSSGSNVQSCIYDIGGRKIAVTTGAVRGLPSGAYVVTSRDKRFSAARQVQFAR